MLYGAVAIDSRTACPGDIFCAFRGDQIDAHTLVPDLVSRGIFCVGSAPLGLARYAQVADVTVFLAEFARIRRAALRAPVLALTGSSGKTTTRVMTTQILAKNGLTVHETRGNLNNHLGLPLVLLNAPLSCEAVVLEMGMNHAGEIAHLCRIADPDAVLITNIGFAHIGNFDSRQALAAAKLEIFEHSRGRIAVNLDDPFVRAWAERRGERAQTTFSAAGRQADIMLERGEDGLFSLRWRGHLVPLSVRSLPDYFYEDLLAALALAAPFVRDPMRADAVLDALPLPSFRGETIRDGGRVFIADCYNANPDSMHKAIAAFVRSAESNALPSYLVLGDMAELGKFAEKFHRELVKYLKTLTVVNKIFLVGEEFEKVRDEFIDDERLVFFRTIADLKNSLPEEGRFLVKGSRRNHLEQLFTAQKGD